MAAIALALALAGCGNHDRTRVVVSMRDMSEPYEKALVEGLRDEADKLGVRLMVVDGFNNPEKQMVDLESARVQKVDGVLTFPQNETVFPRIQALLDDGIPVNVLSPPTDNKLERAGFVHGDDLMIGKMMGEWVVGRYPSGARVAILSGPLDHAASIKRVQGMHEVLSAHGDQYPVVLEKPGNWHRAEAVKVMQQFVEATPLEKMPQVILAANDEMAMGALDALQISGRNQLGIALVGCDATPVALAAVSHGQLAATVDQAAAKQAQFALRSLLARIGEKGPVPNEAIEPVMVTATTLAKPSASTQMR
ncbi:hypothetical protein XthCFBP4691_14305 [Xanthomonas theicola]|uniref:Periplasmic binding protein domain-containing protein n=3 Tax=Xanthomonas theicola TaxID=56464 RepID=A0A2S6ZCT8_9XANT|nr:hypothetical protein XthCFBP4691_14305 [Xanthomonas theicola]